MEDENLLQTISIASPLKMSQKTGGMSFKRQKHPHYFSNQYNKGDEGAAAFRYSF